MSFGSSNEQTEGELSACDDYLILALVLESQDPVAGLIHAARS